MRPNLLVGQFAKTLAAVATIGAGTFIAACGGATPPPTRASFGAGGADENDPQTWVKRLDDQAQRGPAIQRLGQFFEDGMTKAGNKPEDPAVTALLDTIAEPLAKDYVKGNLDEKTRKDLIKILSEMKDPRTQPAFAKALNDFEAGKNDDDVHFAAQGVRSLAKLGKVNDQATIDALWNAFARFRVSKANSLRLVKALHDAVLDVKHPSYGAKAQAKLDAPVNRDDVHSLNDELQFWQRTSIQIIGELKYEPAVKALVSVLLTPSKIDLNATTRTALARMPVAATKVLVSVLGGGEPEVTKNAKEFEDKAHLAIVADALGSISRVEGREAVIAALATTDSNTVRTALAQSLVQFPPDPKVLPAFKAAYLKIPADANVGLLGGLNPRAALLQAAAYLYDTSLVDWLAKESTSAKGDDFGTKLQMRLLPMESAIKLMTRAQKRSVEKALAKAKADVPKDALEHLKEMFKYASEELESCKEDVACYLKILEDPIPPTPPTATMRSVKASWMTVIYGGGDKAASTRGELLKRLEKVKNASARLALVQAIDRLTPEGDAKVADDLDKLVESDKKSGDIAVLVGDEAVVKVASRLRARAAK